MQEFKLANVLLKADDILRGNEELLYRIDGAADYSADDDSLAIAGEANFLTYFNALPLAKWREYTNIENVSLHLEIAGGLSEVYLCYAYAEGSGQSAIARVHKTLAYVVPESDGFQSIEIAIPFKEDAVLVGFAIDAPDAAVLRNAYYVTSIEDDFIRPVRIALATTTFNNEQYIKPNIDLVRNQVLASDDIIAGNFHMFVVDNGQTLDADALSGDGVTVVPNPNVGGAGGFARGMMCAMEAEEPFTHVLLMDDDVHVSPESFKRCFNLLSLASDDYKDAFINGAMLELQHPNIQFEDVSFVRDTGGYQRYKLHPLNVAQVDDCVRNEVIPITGRNSYGAWWFSCIPMSAIKQHGLPLPLFVRIDDVEYAMRCQPTYMAMSGICVWHSAFNNRFRASVDGYQYQRNLLICIAVDQCSDERAFMMRYWRIFHMYLRVMNYDAADLWLDALQDYLRGPEWLMQLDGAALLKANGARNEKMLPIENIDDEVVAQLDIRPEWLGGMAQYRNPVMKLLETLPHDRHWFPDFMLLKKPAAVDCIVNSSPWNKVAMRRTLIALDAEAENAHVREMDRERWAALQKRYREVKADYNRRGVQVAQAYRDAMPTMTSIDFWKDYLQKRS